MKIIKLRFPYKTSKLNFTFLFHAFVLFLLKPQLGKKFWKIKVFPPSLCFSSTNDRLSSIPQTPISSPPLTPPRPSPLKESVLLLPFLPQSHQVTKEKNFIIVILVPSWLCGKIILLVLRHSRKWGGFPSFPCPGRNAEIEF